MLLPPISFADTNQGSPRREEYIEYHCTGINRTDSTEDIVQQVFDLLEEYIHCSGAPRGLVRGRLVLGFDGPGIANVDLEVVDRRVRRILEKGETLDETHYIIAQDGWVGLSFRSAEEFQRLTSGTHPEEQIQGHCEIVLRSPVRH